MNNPLFTPKKIDIGPKQGGIYGISYITSTCYLGPTLGPDYPIKRLDEKWLVPKDIIYQVMFGIPQLNKNKKRFNGVNNPQMP